MKAPSFKTISANKNTVNKEWVLIDAEGQPLGRLASTIAYHLRGKNKVNFTPHVDCGDNVIVINAEKVALTGNKRDAKVYIHHTGYPGGQRTRSVDQVLAKDPTGLVTKAVKGMLPKNRLGRALFNNMHAYAGGEHPHEAQKPRTITLN
ncbi:MAG: 50S ribosomal protein L13 [Flavobacteriales bacterium]|nr:50S ribosomal protein L13 [Flavobacteriales bacterium]MCB9190887.1 50S ribosomal protein L13 [Flavobacteriales bacterium]MCB9205362.1 50S ribosomal protein L13 [Flavobacteriales bacterium]